MANPQTVVDFAEEVQRLIEEHQPDVDALKAGAKAIRKALPKKPKPRDERTPESMAAARAIFEDRDAHRDKRFEAIPGFWTKELEREHSQMPYEDFLRSTYWYVVREYVKASTFWQCSICRSTGKLHVHHTNYLFRGQEHIRWHEDLKVVCPACHRLHHYGRNA